MKKRWIAALLAACMLLGLFPAALAETGGESSTEHPLYAFSFTVSDDWSLTVGQSMNTPLNIPSGENRQVLLATDSAGNTLLDTPTRGWFKDTYDPSESNFAAPLNNGTWTFTAGSEVVLYLRANQTITSCVVADRFMNWVNVKLHTDDSTIPEYYAKVTFDGNAEWDNSNISFRINDSFWADLRLNKLIPPRVLMSSGSEVYDSLTIPLSSTMTVSFSEVSSSGSIPLNSITGVSVTGSAVTVSEANGAYTLTTGTTEGDATITVTYGDSQTITFPVVVYDPPTRKNEYGGSFGRGQAAYVEDYTIGFGGKENGTDANVYWINEENYHFVLTSSPSTDMTYYQAQSYEIIACTTEGTSGDQRFVLAQGVGIEIKRAWLEQMEGDSTVFSLSQSVTSQIRTEFAEDAKKIEVYCRPGRISRVLLCAEIEITVGGQKTTAIVCYEYYSTLSAMRTETRPDNDTIEELNAYLAQLANATRELSYVHYDIYLGNTTYKTASGEPGVITVPTRYSVGTGENEGKTLLITLHGSQNGTTVIEGSVDMQLSRLGFEDLHFKAPDEDWVYPAIFRGTATEVTNCTFVGYVVALRANAGMMTKTVGNVFIHNAIAAYIDLGAEVPKAGNTGLSDWHNNTFIGNETAVRVVSLNTEYTSYKFRIHDCNFINNGCDFDVRHGGSVYYYRNYFGTYLDCAQGQRPSPGRFNSGCSVANMSLQQILEAKTLTKLNTVLVSRKAIVKVANGSRVETNPRWAYPVKDWWNHGNVLINDVVFGAQASGAAAMAIDFEAEYANMLIADWSDEIELPNETSGELILDASAFDNTDKKVIDVVSEGSNAVVSIGTWTFD